MGDSAIYFYLTTRYLVVMNATLTSFKFCLSTEKKTTSLLDMATRLYLLIVLVLSETDVSTCIMLRLIHTCEIFYKFMPFDKDLRPCLVDTSGCVGGVARQSRVVKALREQVQNVLVVDAGNYLEPNYWYAMFGTKVLVDAVTSIGYDAMVKTFFA